MRSTAPDHSRRTTGVITRAPGTWRPSLSFTCGDRPSEQDGIGQEDEQEGQICSHVVGDGVLQTPVTPDGGKRRVIPGHGAVPKTRLVIWGPRGEAARTSGSCPRTSNKGQKNNWDPSRFRLCHEQGLSHAFYQGSFRVFPAGGK